MPTDVGEGDGDAVERLLSRRVEGFVFATAAHRQVVLPASVSEVPTVTHATGLVLHAWP